jgi:hypothetical protein
VTNVAVEYQSCSEIASSAAAPASPSRPSTTVMSPPWTLTIALLTKFDREGRKT